ncbi:synaptic vesicle glycoprotein 2C isoform X2 [Drosophila virilis]
MFVTSVWLFNIINLLSGISLGGVSAAIYPYLSEFNIPRHRAVAINYSTMFVSVTAIYVPATAWAILSSDWSIHILGDFIFRPWRLIMLFSLLPGVIGGLLLIYYPESPKFLLSENKEHQALIAVDWISKFNRGLPITRVLNCNEFTLKPEIQYEENVLSNHKGWHILTNIARATRPLFQKPHGLNFVLCNLAIVCLFFSSNGMQFWFPEIVNRSSNEENQNSTVCQILDSSYVEQNSSTNSTVICSDAISTKTYIDNMIVGIAFLLGFSIQGTLLNPLGRKNVLMAALVFSIASGILLHFVSNPIAVLVLFCLYILLPGLSISIMLGAVVDLVPTNLRGKAVSLCMSLGRLGTIAATNLIGVMLHPYCNTTFALFTFILFVCIVIVFRLPIRNSA